MQASAAVEPCCCLRPAKPRVIRLGHAAYDATGARRGRAAGQRLPAAHLLVAGSVLAGVVAVRFNAHTGAWLVLLVYLATSPSFTGPLLQRRPGHGPAHLVPIGPPSSPWAPPRCVI